MIIQLVMLGMKSVLCTDTFIDDHISLGKLVGAKLAKLCANDGNCYFC